MSRGIVLVTGGAGYVGSHVCLRLSEAGFTPIVFDNLSNGHQAFVKWGPFEHGDILDRVGLAEVFQRYRPVAVMHFAALIEVADSMKEPGRFYQTNVGGAANVIQTCAEAGVDALVFSSTCATYGAPVYTPIDEAHPQAPLNPYGRSKLMVEQTLRDMDVCQGLRSVTLRYFNAAGADPMGRIGEHHDPETHAIPLLLEAAQGRRGGFSIFGADYDSRDGTALRDYVHVLDLADAHVAALIRLLDGAPTDVFNLGTGTGTTVRELVAAVRRITGGDFEVTEAPPRTGDAASLVANSDKARDVLGWVPQYSLDDILAHAWAWQNRDAADCQA